jgi:hypothetical protein
MDHKWIFCFFAISSELRHSNNNCTGAQWRCRKISFFCASISPKKKRKFLINVTIYSHLAIIIREPIAISLRACSDFLRTCDHTRVSRVMQFFYIIFLSVAFCARKCLQSFHYYSLKNEKLSQCNMALHYAHIAPFSWVHIWLKMWLIMGSNNCGNMCG